MALEEDNLLPPLLCNPTIPFIIMLIYRLVLPDSHFFYA